MSVGKFSINSLTGFTADVSELVPHANRELVMARLSRPATDIAPVPVSSTAPAAAQELTVIGYGRTKSDWGPVDRHSASFNVGTTTATGFDLAAKTPADATLCKGDAGAPVLRSVGGKLAVVGVVGVVSRSWQNACHGGGADKAGAYGTRVDDISDWVQRTRALSPGWLTQPLVQSGSSLYQGMRLSDGFWTGFDDVQKKAGDLGSIRSSAAVDVNGDTHLLAISDDGRLFHTIRKQDGTWGTFGDVGAAAGVLGNLTQISERRRPPVPRPPHLQRSVDPLG
ncbi:trypsin-like serine protease [Streptomyces sp. KS 21]|uniref:trypsin-like serine protease n=1 Tax=Streptomyces sp. KS 21 TaxID=2485150 RepID=UPI001064261D|nr:trypsin-like serine protease [Streptomyces sp. KS 21]